jgi:hypothetical protein
MAVWQKKCFELQVVPVGTAAVVKTENITMFLQGGEPKRFTLIDKQIFTPILNIK